MKLVNANINVGGISTRKTIKLCLILCVAAYITFSALKMDDHFDLSSLAGAGSRSLLQDQISDTHADPAIDTTIDIIVIVTGEKESFPTWLDRLRSTSIDGASVSLIYGSTDDMIPQDACLNNENDLDPPCQVDFIPETTWTGGHSLLAEEALQKEISRNKKYDYWLFLDDEVKADCSEREWAAEETSSEELCWENIFNYIASDQVPKKASSVALPLVREGRHGYGSSHTTGLSAFGRDHIAYILSSWRHTGFFSQFKILRSHRS
mmetsp:Transcript_1327/g.1567  ORF Transcript_1327/g.1567 Transcript_1327/m.1567 type:complete len:265 (-) Transcript_1327:1032-1826(-)